MGEFLVVAVCLIAGLGAIARLAAGLQARWVALDRLDEGLAEPQTDETPAISPRQAAAFNRRSPWLPWAVAGVVGAVAFFGFRLNSTYAALFSAIAGLLVREISELVASRRDLLIETQLADAIDLMVASLRSGAGVLNSLENATNESRSPLRPQFEEILGRIRFGDDSTSVFRGLEARVPLETFRLFAAALIVHGEVGGSLAPTLATVGRIIRDRIELTRRIRSLTVQSRVSIVGILGATYFLGLVMWRTDPGRVEEFLETYYGRLAFTGVVFLQCIGVVWSSSMSRLKY